MKSRMINGLLVMITAILSTVGWASDAMAAKTFFCKATIATIGDSSPVSLSGPLVYDLGAVGSCTDLQYLGQFNVKCSSPASSACNARAAADPNFNSAAFWCAKGTPNGATIRAYAAVGSNGPKGAYKAAQTKGVLVNKPAVTQITHDCNNMPGTWLDNPSAGNGGHARCVITACTSVRGIPPAPSWTSIGTAWSTATGPAWVTDGTGSVWYGIPAHATTTIVSGPECRFVATAGSSGLVGVADQARMNSFYALDNVVTVRITMPPLDWNNLRNAQPYGGSCNFSYVGSRYDWYTATSVTIETTQFPNVNGSFSFNNVGIKKKSYCGSLSSSKPSLHLKYDNADEAAVEALIGTKHLMFNNSIQDAEYIRQCLGYKLLAEAGVPTSRCNFSRVFVNNNIIGVYVNVEPMKKRLAENNFAGNDNGNVYELDAGEDFVASMLSRTEWDGFSSISNKADLVLANSQIAAGNYASVIDEDAFIRLWAMEIMLKHWDGYAGNRNNTYLYNDIPNPVAAPTVADVNFKLVPQGIDQILKPGSYAIYNSGILANKLAANPGYRLRLRRAVHFLLNNVFSHYRHTNATVPFINSSVGIVNNLLTLSGQGSVNSANVAAITSQLAGLRGSMNTLFAFNFHLAEADFDGDGTSDRTVWRPSQAKFYTILSSTGAITTPIFGAGGDIPVAGDFDGDGRMNWALWRPSTGVWDVRSANGSHTFTTLGANGDVPVVGDFDGDGKSDLTVWSPASAKFSTLRSSTNSVVQVAFGANGDIPVVGNYDADRKTDYALWRPSTGRWDIYLSTTSTHGFKNWGTLGDVPVTRDYDFDGRSDVGVWRPSQAKFYTILSATNSIKTPIFGANGDIPTVGDIDGDVRPDYGLWRPSTGNWDILVTATGVHQQQQWGTTLDVPLPRPQN